MDAKGWKLENRGTNQEMYAYRPESIHFEQDKQPDHVSVYVIRESPSLLCEADTVLAGSPPIPSPGILVVQLQVEPHEAAVFLGQR